MDSSPILVTGSHRSGTTWIGQTLSQHPLVRYIHEPFNVAYPNPIMGLELDTWFAHYGSSRQKNEIRSAFDKLFQTNSIRYAFEKSKTTGLDIKAPVRFCKLLLEHLQSPRVLVKDPIALFSAGWLHETYNFKVICMIRNPFAFVGSLKVAGWDFDFEHLRKQDDLMGGWLSGFAENIEWACKKENNSDLIDRAALLWNIFHCVVLEYHRQYPHWLFVKHDEISMRPEQGFGKIFDYLDLDMNDRVQNYIRKYTSHYNPTDSLQTAYQPRNSKSLLNTWKERLTNDEIDRIQTSTSEIASHFYDDILVEQKP